MSWFTFFLTTRLLYVFTFSLGGSTEPPEPLLDLPLAFVWNWEASLTFFLSVLLFITNYRVSHEILLHAYDEGMTNGDYVFIMLQLEQKQFIVNQRIPAQYHLFPVVEDRRCDYFQALEAVIVVEIKPMDSANNTFADFEKQVSERFNDPIFPSREKVS